MKITKREWELRKSQGNKVKRRFLLGDRNGQFRRICLRSQVTLLGCSVQVISFRPNKMKNQVAGYALSWKKYFCASKHNKVVTRKIILIQSIPNSFCESAD